MTAALITVAQVQPPAPGKKMASVYDTQGQRWLIPHGAMGQYAPGGSYNIEYESSTFQGKTYNTIKGATLVAGAVPGAAVPMQQAAAPQQQTYVRQSHAPAGGQTDDRTRRMDIFVCGAFNNMMNNPQVNPLLLNETELTSFLGMMKRVWTLTLGRPADRGDMNDEIGF